MASTDPPEFCDKCGQQHWKETTPGVMRRTCTGHNAAGGPCGKFPLRGTTVCVTHGAGAPQVRAKAAAVVEHEETMRKVTRGLTSAGIELSKVDPIEELLWAVAVSSAAVKWLAWQVSELQVPDVNATGEFADVVGVDDEGNPRTAQPISKLYGPSGEDNALKIHPLWKEWNAERVRHAKFAKLAVDAGVSERMIRIQEQQSELIVETVLYALDMLRLEDGRPLPASIREQAVNIIAVRFREIETQLAPLGVASGQ